MRSAVSSRLVHGTKKPNMPKDRRAGGSLAYLIRYSVLQRVAGFESFNHRISHVDRQQRWLLHTLHDPTRATFVSRVAKKRGDLLGDVHEGVRLFVRPPGRY